MKKFLKITILLYVIIAVYSCATLRGDSKKNCKKVLTLYIPFVIVKKQFANEVIKIT